MALESQLPAFNINAQQAKVKSAIKLNRQQQQYIVEFSRRILDTHAKGSEIFNKMEIIDQAYARYKSKTQTGDTSGVDANVVCDIFDRDRVTPPIVVSQVDSAVAYMADVFLSGSPLFPVVSTPKNKKWAEQLEVLMDDHATIGGYARQMLMFLRDACKYNYSALHCSWEVMEQFEVLSDFTNTSGQSLKKNKKYYNQVERLDPYNVIRDPDVAPGDIAQKGDYAGWIKNQSYVKMKRELEAWGNTDFGYNKTQILDTDYNSSAVGDQGQVATRTPPQISDYIHAKRQGDPMNWDAYMRGEGQGKQRRPAGGFNKFTFYARIVPADFGLSVPQKGTPQIWKFVVVNNTYVAYAERIVSAYDYIPIFFGQPLEDGLDYQTQSIAEGEIPFQEAASTLFNIRFSAARRAVADRALYQADIIKPSDVNSKNPAAKIPVNIPALSNKTIDSAYKQIPFDMRGTETTISDAREIVSFSQQLQGINGPRQGAFQKGNKSVQEWNDTMGGSDGRSRLPAMTLEYQVFVPMREFMKLNILQYGENVAVVSQKTGEAIDVNIAELRKTVMSFKLADGFTPKSKLASTEAISSGLNMISTSPILQQTYGAAIARIFAHLMSLMGVKGLEEYTPQQPTAQEGGGPLPAIQPPGLPDPNAPLQGQA